VDRHELLMDGLLNVAKLCAVAATTAPKSGGQLLLKGSKSFIEIVSVEDHNTPSIRRST